MKKLNYDKLKHTLREFYSVSMTKAILSNRATPHSSKMLICYKLYGIDYCAWRNIRAWLAKNGCEKSQRYCEKRGIDYQNFDFS